MYPAAAVAAVAAVLWFRRRYGPRQVQQSLNLTMDEPAQGVAPKVPLVAVFVSAFDPISSADLRVTAYFAFFGGIKSLIT